MSLDLPIANLADWNSERSRVHLRLTIYDGRHNGCLNHLCADSGLLLVAASISSVVSIARNYENLDWLALRRPITVVQVVKVPGATLVKGG